MVSALEHTVRASLIDKERCWSLGPDALHWRQSGSEGEIPYADVEEVRLISYASYGGVQYQCMVKGRESGKFKLRSHHYRSLGSFEDRTETYTPFVREMLGRMAARAPQARFMAGSTGLWYAWAFVGLLWLCVPFFLLMALKEGAAVSVRGIAAIAIAFAAVPFILRGMRQGKGRPFDPADPPSGLLGG